jgi:secondary thiamine-phosphate synthase enzyme
VKVSTSETNVQAGSRLSFCDLSDDLRRAVKNSGITDGTALVFCAHTTCSLVINEWEEGVLKDLTRRLDALVPSDTYYAHDDLSRRTQNLIDHERKNGQAHVIQMVLGGSSQMVPVVGGEPVLGVWQRLFLLELDEPKPRRCVFQITGV